MVEEDGLEQGGWRRGVRVHGFLPAFVSVLFCVLGKKRWMGNGPYARGWGPTLTSFFFSCLFLSLVDDGAGVQTVYADQTV
jgi:hypothetical protein